VHCRPSFSRDALSFTLPPPIRDVKVFETGPVLDVHKTSIVQTMSPEFLHQDIHSSHGIDALNVFLLWFDLYNHVHTEPTELLVYNSTNMKRRFSNATV